MNLEEVFVRRYRIDENNPAELLDAANEPGTQSPAFSSLEELQEVAKDWPIRRLVEVWNKLPGVRAVSRFENRSIALQRIWRALAESDGQPTPTVRSQPNPRMKRSKTTVVLQMLRRRQGATLRALMKATQWQAHTVRGFLSGKVGKQLGLTVRSFKQDGERVYSVANVAPEAES